MLHRSRVWFLLLIAFAVLFEVVSDALFKQWSNTNRVSWLVVGMLLYVASTAFWAFSLKYQNLSTAIVVFTITNLLAVLMVGRLVFHETLSWQAKLGVLLGIVSVALMEID